MTTHHLMNRDCLFGFHLERINWVFAGSHHVLIGTDPNTAAGIIHYCSRCNADELSVRHSADGEVNAEYDDLKGVLRIQFDSPIDPPGLLQQLGFCSVDTRLEYEEMCTAMKRPAE